MTREHKFLIHQLETTGQDLVELVKQLPEDEIRSQPAPDAWSIHAIAAHLRDTEQKVFLERIRRILSEPEPPQVASFDQEEWNREHYTGDEPLSRILREFRAARRKELQLLSGLKDKDWAREAIHPDFAVINIEWLAWYNYNHTLEHLHELTDRRQKALRQKLKAGKA